MPARDLPRTTVDWEAAARRQAAVWLAVALLLGALLAVLAYQAWHGALPQTGPRRPAVFAVRPLEPGTLIVPGLVAPKSRPWDWACTSWPTPAMHAGAARPRESKPPHPTLVASGARPLAAWQWASPQFFRALTHRERAARLTPDLWCV